MENSDWNSTLDSLLPSAAPSQEQLAAQAPAPKGGNWDDLLDSIQDPLWQHKQLAAQREKVKDSEEPLTQRIGRRAVPFFSTAGGIANDQMYKSARDRFNAGTASSTDTATIAQYERQQQIDESRGTGGKIANALLGIPAIVGEAAATGGTAPLSGGIKGVAKYAGQKALQTPLMPSLYAPTASERSVAQGGEIYDPKNLAPALGMGIAQNMVLGSVGHWAKGIANPVGRWAANVGIGMGEQAAVDVAAGTADKFLPEVYRTNTKFGMIGHIVGGLRGEEGEGDKLLQSAATQVVTFGVFAAMHGHPKEAKDTIDRLKETLNRVDVKTAEEAAKLITDDPNYQATLKAIQAGPPPEPESGLEQAPEYNPEIHGTPKEFQAKIEAEKAKPTPEPPQATPEPPAAPPEPPEDLSTLRAALKAVGLNEKGLSDEKVVSEAKRLAIYGKLEEKRPEPPAPQKPATYGAETPISPPEAVFPPQAEPMPSAAQETALDAREQHIVNQVRQGRSLASIGKDPNIQLTKQRVQQLYNEARKKLGIQQKLSEQQAEAKAEHAVRMAENSQHIAPGDLGVDPRAVAKAVGARIEKHNSIDKRLNKLTNEYAEEIGRGKLTAERERHYDDAFSRLYAEVQRLEGRGAEKGAEPQELPPDVAQRGTEQSPPVRPADAASLQANGAAPAQQENAGVGGAPGGERAAGGGEAAGNQLAAARAAKVQTALSAAKKRGGISEESARKLWGNILVDEIKKEVPTVFKDSKGGKGRRLLDDLSEEMARAGEISVDPDKQHAHEVLYNAIQEKLSNMAQDFTKLAERQEQEYYRELQRAQAQGHSAEAIAEATRSGEAVGEDEAARGSAEGAQREDVPSFNFGANEGLPLTEAEQRTIPGGGQEDAPEGRKLKTTALANAKIDQERALQKLPPIMAEARIDADPEVWDRAMKRLDADPEAGAKLVAELAKKPRLPDVTEQALLLHRKVWLTNAYNRAAVEYIQNFKADAATIAPIEARIKSFEEQTEQLHNVLRSTGTELGRSFRFRRLLAADDFSLQGMLQSATAAKGKPLTPEETQQIKALQQQIAALQAKVTEAELKLQGSGKIRSVPDSPEFAEVKQAQLAAKTMQDKFTTQLGDYRLARRTTYQKLEDWIVKLRRAMLISSPTTFGKIAAASAERIGIAPMEEMAGTLLRQVPGLNKIASIAPREGRGFRLGVEKRAFMDSFTKGVMDAWQTLKTGKSELDVLYGPSPLPRSWLDLVGEWHAAAKAPAVRAEFTRSFLNRMDAAIAKGENVTNRGILQRLGMEAYQDSQRAKFQQDNRVVDAWKAAIKKLESGGPGSKGLALSMKIGMPIVRVPTNLVGEAFQYAFGSVTGSVHAAVALRRGVENLKPAEADTIMRQLKKGSLGAAVLALGYFNPGLVGGYYQPGQKRKDEDVKAGGVRTPMGDVPSWAMHNPLLEVLQMGATVRRVQDSHKKGETQGIGAGTYAGALGLAEEVPFVRQPIEMAKAADPKTEGHFWGQMVKSLAVPQFIQWLAGRMDVKPGESPVTGEAQPRKPKGFVQEVEMGVPGLRSSVPAR